MQIELTQEEINLIAGMFNTATTPILAENSIQVCSLAQSILQKFKTATISSTKGEPQ